VFGQKLLHDLDPPFGRDIWQANQSAVGGGVAEDESAEVRVDRDQNATFGGGPLKQCRVTGIRAEIGDMNCVMALGDQPP
jgi:hypothetical protein